jgi:hypothetical protein
MIQGVQEQLPGYRLRLATVADAHHDRVRFQWEAGGTAEAPVHFVGTDFGLIASDGRLKSITGSLDEAPDLLVRNEHTEYRIPHIGIWRAFLR